MKKIIVTADDLGIDIDTNRAIEEDFVNGVLTSSCIIANGEGFNDAVENVINKHQDLDIGVHINIIEGKALTQNTKSPLTDKNGIFNKSYIYMLVNSYNKKFLDCVEKECRCQIETILEAGIKPTYINTHVHTHSIPNLFELVCKLAKEYGIKNIRTQGEKPYYTKGILRHTTIRYMLNIIKNVLLNTFTIINRRTVKKYGLNTNKYFLGVLYTGCMDEFTIMSGIERLPKDSIAEIIIHPSVNDKRPQHYAEYKALISEKLLQYFEQENIEAINWKFFE